MVLSPLATTRSGRFTAAAEMIGDEGLDAARCERHQHHQTHDQRGEGATGEGEKEGE